MQSMAVTVEAVMCSKRTRRRQGKYVTLTIPEEQDIDILGGNIDIDIVINGVGIDIPEIPGAGDKVELLLDQLMSQA